jgi:Flp pilus assembly protein TadB
MNEAGAAFLVVLSIAVWTSSGGAVGRARRLSRRPPAAPKRPETEVNRRRKVLLVSALSGLAVAITLGGVAGVIGGVAAAVAATYALHRMEPRLVRIRRERLIEELPLAAGMLAACLRAGRSPERAVELIGQAVPGPLGVELSLVAEALRLGARAEVAWARILDEPALAPFGRALIRTWDSGAPLADTLDRLADDARRTIRSQADRRARAVGVKAALPLGLCFLPAFLLIGVVPVIAGSIVGLLP